MGQDGSEGAGYSTQWKNATLFLITLGAIFLCGLLAFPFLPAITGAVVLATVTVRPHDWLKRKLRWPTLAASVLLIAVVLSIVLPSILVVASVTRHAQGLVSAVRDGSTQQWLTGLLHQHPKVGALLQASVDQVDLSQATRSAAGVLATGVGGFLSHSVSALAQIVIMLFLLFFLYRDREQALSALRFLLPLREPETDYLLGRIGDTIYATVLGRLVTATVQGILAGLAYWALGVPGALLWAILTLAMSSIPGLGAFLVWMPVAIYLGLNGHWLRAILMTAWGSLVVSTIDNVLYPMLVGSRLRLHGVPIFIAVLGGILLFGVPGLVLGPVVLTAATSLLHIWRTRADLL